MELFERLTDTITVVNLAREGNLDRLQKLIRGGCRMVRREKYDPWLTPLDAAVMAGNAACADLLLCGGARLEWSSIIEAIKIDSLSILEVFFKHDPSFFAHQKRDLARERRQNQRLDSWLFQFTALDYALSIGSPACSQFLTEIGAPKASNFITCRCGHHAPYIVEVEFVPLSGVDAVGFSKVTKGYYCAWCMADIEKNGLRPCHMRI